MSDQFNISSIPGFSISQIEPSDLSTVLDCMNEIYRELPEKSWFSMDEREDSDSLYDSLRVWVESGGSCCGWQKGTGGGFCGTDFRSR